MPHQADVIVIGAGLAGLVAAVQAADRGRTVILLDQEGRQSLGGQAWWSLGGLFMINTPEQRRLGVHDSLELATSDWMGSAQFDRNSDGLPRAFAENYLEFAAGEMRSWLHSCGLRWFPVVGWAERRFAATGHGNSVPRFHVTWGTGTGVVRPFVAQALAHEKSGRIKILCRHQVTGLSRKAGQITGVRGDVLADDPAPRGASSNRQKISDFNALAGAVIIATGGFGGNHKMVRKYWPKDRLGRVPKKMVSGVPDYVDGKMMAIAQRAGAQLINTDRMWHYTEGLENWDPIWPNHGIRILPGPSALWLDARGDRLEAPCYPGFDTLGTLKRILSTGHDHSWFILSQKIIEKEFALSGSEQNPDLTSAKWLSVIRERLAKGATGAVEAFKEKGADFVVAGTLSQLVSGMNKLTPKTPVSEAKLAALLRARDQEMLAEAPTDAQVQAIHKARNYIGDKLIRTAKPHAILDPKNGPLIAVRLNILTRKSLGGIQTELDTQALDAQGERISGLYAVGEAAGFGAGGYHGHNALEGTFLGGCLYSGRLAGRAV